LASWRLLDAGTIFATDDREVLVIQVVRGANAIDLAALDDAPAAHGRHPREA
jgi:hypothetical protein